MEFAKAPLPYKADENEAESGDYCLQKRDTAGCENDRDKSLACCETEKIQRIKLGKPIKNNNSEKPEKAHTPQICADV